MLYYVFSGPLSLRAYVPEIKFDNNHVTIGGTPYIEPNSHQDYCSKRTLYTPETVKTAVIMFFVFGEIMIANFSISRFIIGTCGNYYSCASLYM